MKKPFRIPTTITEEELHKLLLATKKANHKLAFALGFYQCMRISEIVKLKPDDIDYNLKLIWIKEGKRKKDRKIPIHPIIIRGLKKLPIGVGARALEKKFKEVCTKVLKRPELYFHCLRHSGITYYITQKKWNELEVQRMAGHSSITVTQIYSHVNPQDLVNRMWE